MASFMEFVIYLLSKEWGCEGYHLWMVCDEEKKVVNGKGVRRQLSVPDDVEVLEADELDNADDPETNGEPEIGTCLLQMHWIKSSLTVNPCMVSEDYI